MPSKIVSFSAAFLFFAATEASNAGEMRIGGTGAAHGILIRLSQAFNALHPEDRIDVVAGLGSSGGILGVSEGALQLTVSGRDLKAEEKAAGLKSVPFLDTPFVFVTSHAKPQQLTRADVVSIYDGGLTRWPDGSPIKIVLRPKSDTVSSFLMANFDNMSKALEKSWKRTELPVAATDQDNARIAAHLSNSFSGMTMIQFVTDKPSLKIIALDGISASVEAAEAGSYGLKMRLYSVTKSEPSPIARRFMDFLQSPQAAKIIRENGGISLITRTASVQ